MKKLTQHRMPTIYDHFDFPRVEYKEYPKWVKSPADGKSIVVYNSREEKELLEESPKDFVTKGELIPEKDERTLLLEKAERLGIEVDGRIGVARLRTLVNEADTNFAA